MSIFSKKREYLLNQKDGRYPVQFKLSSRSREHRYGREFRIEIKRDKLKDVNHRCELCSQKVNLKTAEFHHILSLSYAFHYFPEIPKELLRSKHNCQILCEQCHIDIHKNDCLAIYSILAIELLKVLKKWETNPPRLPMTRKQRRNLAQQLEKERRRTK